MMRLIRWYPVAEPVKHLRSVDAYGAPDWVEGFYPRDSFDSEEEWKKAYAACVAFHGKEEDIVRVRVTRTKVARKPRLTTAEKVEVNNDYIINAIKMVRHRTGLGLKEAKDYVEATPEGQAYLARRGRRLPVLRGES